MDPYQQLVEFLKQHTWRELPDALRAVLPAMAKERSENQESVWYPPIVYIEPTNHCNANCIMCPHGSMKRTKGMMTMELYRQIIEQISALGPSEIRLFHYGEPMLHPHLPDMVRMAHEAGLAPRFQTNGLVMKEKILIDLLDAGMNYIGISVNGLTGADYEKIRPGHTYEQLIEQLQTVRRVIDASEKKCSIHINAHVDKDEINERDNDVQSFKKQWFRVADSLSISGVSLYEKTTLLRDGNAVEVQQKSRGRKNDSTVVCAEPFDRLIIKWDGRVSPCCTDYDGALVIGDITEQSLEDIWMGVSLQSLRKNIRKQQYHQIDLCQSCPKFYSKTYNLTFVRKEN